MVLHAAKTPVQYLRSIKSSLSWHLRSRPLVPIGKLSSDCGTNPGGGFPEICKQECLETLVALSSPCGNNRVHKLLACHRFFQTTKDTRALWVNQLPKLEVPIWGSSVQSRVGGMKGLSSVNSRRQSDEIASLCKEGQLDKAVDALHCMDEQGAVVSVDIYRCLLSACTEKKDLCQAKRVHAHLEKHGLESTRYLGESVVKTLVKCGGLGDALQVFQRLQKRSVVSWTSLISGYTDSGQGQQALKAYEWMLVEGVQPNAYTFVSLLKACSSMADLKEGRRIHAEAVKYGCGLDLFVRNCLVNMYGSCGSIVDAQTVFDRLCQRDIISWNSMLAAHVLNSQADTALVHYKQMQEEGWSPNSRTFINGLLACGMLAEKEEGAALDGQTFKTKSLWAGKVIHAEAQRKGCGEDIFVGSTLVRVYGKCGSTLDAQNVLDGLRDRNVVSWNAMLAAYVEQGQGVKALLLYEKMLIDGLEPDAATFVTAVQACNMLAQKADVDGSEFSNFNAFEKGKVLHSYARSKGYDSNVLVGTAFVSLYGNCGYSADAEHAINGLSEKNIMSWNALLAAYIEEGRVGHALQLYEEMQMEGVSPDAWSLLIVLQACGTLAEKEIPTVVGEFAKWNCLQWVKALHADGRKKGYDLDAFTRNTLVSVYRKCGSILDAQNVFDALSGCDVVTWTSMLAAYVEHGQPEKAWQMHEQMREEGVSPDAWTFVSVLQACGMLAEMENQGADLHFTKAKSLDKGKVIHADAWRKGYDRDIFVSSTLVSMYGKCGSIEDARVVFEEMPERNVVSWNAMLAAYVDQCEGEKGLQTYEQMQEEEILSDAWTLVTVFRACGILAEANNIDSLEGMKYLQQARAIHALAWRKGYEANVFVVSTLIAMYAKYRCLSVARGILDQLSESNVVLWNAMLTGYVEQGEADMVFQLYEQILEEGVSPDAATFVGLLQACVLLAEKEEQVVVDGHKLRVKALERAKAIHAVATEEGYDSDVFLGSTLLSMYGKCGSPVDAQTAFCRLSHLDVVAWTSMLSAHVELGQAENALDIYDQMQQEGVTADARTFVSALQACNILAEKHEDGIDCAPAQQIQTLFKGNEIYAHAQSKGFGSDVSVCSSLIGLYAKCGSLAEARKVFDGLCESSVVLWNSMLMAYIEQDAPEKALALYSQMQQQTISPVTRTFICLFQACGRLAEKEEMSVTDGVSLKAKSLRIGKALHLDAESWGFHSDVFVTNSLITMYGKCGSTDDAWNVFDGSSEKDVVSWNAMLAVYVEHGKGEKALDLFKNMQQEGPAPDDITLVCILQACSKTGSLVILRHMHQNLVSFEKSPNPVVTSALIHAYGRCASMVDAQAVFDSFPNAGVVLWNALIAGYARQGDFMASLQQYEKMQLAGANPNAVTFVSLLSACSYAGLVDKGVEYFESMSRDYGVTPEIEHYVTMVDLLGRAGCFVMLEHLLSSMPMQPNLDLWLCLLGACRKHRRVVLGEEAFNRAVSLDPTHASAYVLMSNVYADAGLLDRATEVRQKGIRKTPGQSWIECAEEVSSFLAGDSEHPRYGELHEILKKATAKLKYEEHTGNAHGLLAGHG